MAAPSGLQPRSVTIPADGVRLEGELTEPEGARGIVLFAHGSGSGRRSPRNGYVARVLQQAGLGTLLLDLLTEEEEADRRNVFDIDRLAIRLRAAANWLLETPSTRAKSLGYFGASTGAAAALRAAARDPGAVRAVVSRGGRPDLAEGDLDAVRAPTMLIVGGADRPVIPLNQFAMERLSGEREMVIVPGAGHLFEEPGALDEVARLARDWFLRYLPPGSER